MTYRAGDGTHFDAPPDADFQKIYMYGQSLRGKPISDQIAAIRAAIAQNGIFDFQRSNGIFISDYQNASNYGVGVLMNGAGYSWFDTFMMAMGYGFLNSKPAYDPKRLLVVPWV